MRVLIIRDDRPEAGLGHVMRCRALAEALVEQGCEIRYANWEVAHNKDSREWSDAHVRVVDDYRTKTEYFHDWTGIPNVVLDDFGIAYPWARLVVQPLGEHTLIRRAVRDAKLGRYMQSVTDVLDLRTRRDIPPDEVPRAMLEAGKVICGAGLTALEARYLGVLKEWHVLAPNQERTAAFLSSGERIDGLGAARVAKLIMGLVKP